MTPGSTETRNSEREESRIPGLRWWICSDAKSWLKAIILYVLLFVFLQALGWDPPEEPSEIPVSEVLLESGH